MLDFGESDKMIKISGKVDKSNTYNGLCGNISLSSSVNKEQNITAKPSMCLTYLPFHLFLSHIFI